MSKTINYGIAISLIILCLSFLLFMSISKSAWSQDESKLERLVDELKDADPDVRVKAAHALLKMGPEAKEAVPVLIEALEDEDETVRWYAAEALERLNTPEALKALNEYKKKSK